MTEKQLLKKVIALLKKEKSLCKRYSGYITDFENQLARANLDRYRIGVIGVTSSGKSTMINAILGDEILSMAVKPSSSQLVTCSKSTEKKATVYFKNKSPAVYRGALLTPEIIKKYSDENYNQKNKEQVSMLELSTPNFALPEDLLLVDSPGLEAYGLEGHERLTMNTLLPTIDFCIFVTTFKTNSDEKMRSVLNEIAGYNCPVIIVQNMLDSVKPSPDGKKSSLDVANEHKKRVERIVDRSGISDKSSVKIVQISSRQALEGRIENNPEKLKKSNYSKLINAVSTTFNSIKPKIEGKRISTLKKRLIEIRNEAMQDISPDAADSKQLQFEFEGLDLKLKKESEKTALVIKEVIGTLWKQREYLEGNKGDKSESSENYLSRSLSRFIRKFAAVDDFSESDVDVIKSLVSKSQKALLSEMKRYNKAVSEYCTMLGADERRLRVVESFGEVPELRKAKKTGYRWEEKSGIGNAVKRFFGGLFGRDDWGRKRVSYDKFDEEATRENAVNYLNRVISMYGSACEKWSGNADSLTAELIEQIELRRQAFTARRMEIADEKAMLKVIDEMELLIRSIPDIKAETKGKISHTASDLEIRLSEIQVSQNVLKIHRYAEQMRGRIHSQVMRQYGINDGDLNVIVSRDAYCAAMLLKNGFSVKVSEKELESGIKRYDNTIVIASPTAECLKAFSEKVSRKINWLVLFNATQYGAAMNELSRNKLNEAIKEKDSLYFVVQDFEELRNGDGVRDALMNMKNMGSELGFSHNLMIMLNDNNPVYSLTALQAQFTPCRIHTDEIALIDMIKKHFNYLVDHQEKTLDEIIKAF